MWDSTICQAIGAGLCLELRYDGYSRIVEPHAYGLTKDNHEIMRVWQVRGGSQSHEPVGWKLMRLDEAGTIYMTDERSYAPRPGYKRGDKAMQKIYCEV